MECRSWNTESDDVCYRCEGKPKHQDRPRGSFSEHQSDIPEDCDEFGRPKKRPKKRDTVNTVQWPPPFDKRSATYVFDARSGMFYHAISQFFFDPMTKLYFSTKEQKYYRHTPEEDSPFQPVEQQATKEEIVAASLIVKAPAIAITLKTKNLPGSNKAAAMETSPPSEKKVVPKKSLPVVHKAYSANMERWLSRDTLLLTKAGKPICPWCRRKFKDVSHLQRHQDQSERHKVNVAKWKEQQRIKKEYRDRAWERRRLHEPEVAPVSLPFLEPSVVAAEIRPQDILGEENIGNQMLQKLGWKSGKSLGRTGEATNHLEKDWERIESMARSAAGGN